MSQDIVIIAGNDLKIVPSVQPCRQAGTVKAEDGSSARHIFVDVYQIKFCSGYVNLIIECF
jgi:hypothetical protein